MNSELVELDKALYELYISLVKELDDRENYF